MQRFVLNVFLFFVGSAASFSLTERKFQREMLDAHNKYRQQHRAPNLQLDDQLNRSAQKHAERLAKLNKLAHSNVKGIGENLHSKRSSKPIDRIDGKTYRKKNNDD